VAAAGIGLAYVSYLQWWELPFRSSTLYVVLFRRYFLDEIYSAVFLVRFRWVCHLLWRMDGRLIDGAVNQVASFIGGAGRASSRIDERVIDGTVNQVAHFVGGTAMASTEVDEEAIDARVDWVAELNQTVSDIMRRLQTGLIQNYLLAMALGIFVLACLYIIFR
ncbi:MAG: NADH-quinone oxidoreductase subunit L, NADH dehydrogenase I, chain L, NDH-1, chain L, partial [candidate division NC10 bacterium CSP1-5]